VPADVVEIEPDATDVLAPAVETDPVADDATLDVADTAKDGALPELVPLAGPLVSADVWLAEDGTGADELGAALDEPEAGADEETITAADETTDETAGAAEEAVDDAVQPGGKVPPSATCAQICAATVGSVVAMLGRGKPEVSMLGRIDKGTVTPAVSDA